MLTARFRRLTALGVIIVASTPAWADSEMQQSPLLEKGAPAACDALRQRRVQRGGSFWQYDCPDVPRSDGQGDRQAR